MADYKGRIGNLIRDARKHRGLTQHQLAELLGTSQSAINRIEKGHQNLSLEMLARIGAALDSEIVALGAGPTHLRVDGPTTLSGSIDVKTSKNAGVALLCASLLNKGRTTLRKVARIEEVNRLQEKWVRHGCGWGQERHTWPPFSEFSTCWLLGQILLLIKVKSEQN